MSTQSIELRVRYKETDQMGFVYYSNYLVWFEIARTEYFRKQGLVYKTIEQERGLYLPVVDAYCRYRVPVRYDEVVIVEVGIKEMKASRIVFEYKVKVEGKTVASGTTTHAFINKEGQPVAIPEDIKAIL